MIAAPDDRLLPSDVRLYLSNDSYPELREFHGGFVARLSVWTRAFMSAACEWPIWVCFALQFSCNVIGAFWGLFLSELILGQIDLRWLLVGWICGVVPAGVLALSWGGDIIRPHLRRHNLVARRACPGCGHTLTSQLGLLRDPDTTSVRCPECGVSIPAEVFQPPFVLPRQFRAFSFGRSDS